MITRSGLGRSTQLKPRSSNTCSRPTKASPERRSDPARGQPSMAEAPLPRASSTAARMSAWTTPWPRRSARTKKQGKSHTISSSSRTRFLMILFRGSVAATYRDRGPQAHQPTGSAACEAKIPIGVELAAAIAPNRRWLPPLSQPAANWLRVTQNAMHQQRRVVLWLSNSLLRSGRSFDSTSRVSIAAPMDKTLPRPGRKPTSGTPRGSCSNSRRMSVS